MISTARKKIKRAKELLEKKNKNIKQSLHKSIYNKELLSILEKVEVCNTLSVKIDTLIKNKAFYEISENIIKLRSLIDAFKEFEGTLVIKNLKENEKSKTQEVCNLVNTFLRNYFYYYEQNFDWDALNAVDSTFKFDKVDFKSYIPGENRRTSLSRNFLSEQKNFVESSLSFMNTMLKLYNLDLEKFILFDQKLQQIKTVLNCPPKNVDLNYIRSPLMLADPEVFESIHIIKYICISFNYINHQGFSLEVSQYEKYSALIRKADSIQKELISNSDKSDIMNLYLSIKAADIIGVFPLIFIVILLCFLIYRTISLTSGQTSRPLICLFRHFSLKPLKLRNFKKRLQRRKFKKIFQSFCLALYHNLTQSRPLTTFQNLLIC